MRKMLALALTAVLLATLAGCANSGGDDNKAEWSPNPVVNEDGVTAVPDTTGSGTTTTDDVTLDGDAAAADNPVPDEAAPYVALWHGSPVLGSDWNERYLLCYDGTFIWLANRMDGEARTRYVYGAWGVTGGNIELDVQLILRLEGGTLTPYAVGTYAVGERKVTGVSTGTDNGAQYKEYTYESSTVSDDLIAYIIDDLVESGGWVALVDFNLNDVPGTGQIATESKDEGKILIMDITYENSGYTIKITKTVGELTYN